MPSADEVPMTLQLHTSVAKGLAMQLHVRIVMTLPLLDRHRTQHQHCEGISHCKADTRAV